MTEEKVKAIIALDSLKKNCEKMQYFFEENKDVWWEIRSPHEQQVSIPLELRDDIKSLVNLMIDKIDKKIEQL